MARALATYWWRGPETVAAGFDRPDTPFAEWDAVSQDRGASSGSPATMRTRASVLAVTGSPADRDLSLELPGYETAFRAFAPRVRLAAPLTGDAAARCRRRS